MEMPINRYQCECVGIVMQLLSGCASNSLAHEEVGQFEEAHHWNIQAKFYNERLPIVYESNNIGDSLVYFEAQVW